MSFTQNLLIDHIASSQVSKEVTANEAFDALDKAIAGSLSKAVTSADVTLTDAEARNAIIVATGTLTGNRNLIVPARTKIYAIYNNTSGPFTLTVKTPSGTGVAVTQGTRVLLYCDGTNVVALLSALPGFVLSASATLDFDLSASASQDLTITVTGAAAGDVVALGVPNGSVTTDTLFWAWISAADTVKVRAMRISGTPNPASGTFTVKVFK